jgi:hypothetical protein
VWVLFFFVEPWAVWLLHIDPKLVDEDCMVGTFCLSQKVLQYL